MSDRGAERTAVRGTDSTEDTATRPPLTERIQAKLAKAADETARAPRRPPSR